MRVALALAALLTLGAPRAAEPVASPSHTISGTVRLADSTLLSLSLAYSDACFPAIPGTCGWAILTPPGEAPRFVFPYCIEIVDYFQAGLPFHRVYLALGTDPAIQGDGYWNVKIESFVGFLNPLVGLVEVPESSPDCFSSAPPVESSFGHIQVLP